MFRRGNVIGRRVLQLRICTCPKRDMEQEEKHRQKAASVLGNATNCVKPQPLAGEKRRAYWVLVSVIAISQWIAILPFP